MGSVCLVRSQSAARPHVSSSVAHGSIQSRARDAEQRVASWAAARRQSSAERDRAGIGAQAATSHTSHDELELEAFEVAQCGPCPGAEVNRQHARSGASPQCPLRNLQRRGVRAA